MILGRLRRVLVSSLLLLLLGAPGCGDGVPRATVSGEVLLDGQPLSQGAIKFVPMEGTTGVVTGTEIKDGRYELPQAAGAAPGWNRVEITAVKKTGEMVQDPLGPIGSKIEMETSAIAPRFNSGSELKVEIQPGDNTHDFKVESK